MQDTISITQNTIVYVQQFTPPLSTVSFGQLPAADKSKGVQWDGKSEINSTINKVIAVFEIVTAGKIFSFEYGVRAT